MAEVEWIKISTGLFDDEKIKIIEGIKDFDIGLEISSDINPDSIITIWLKMLITAGQQNNSGMFLLNEKIPYTADMLASIFKRPKELVNDALKIFEYLGMIEVIDKVITIPNWSKYQTLDKYELHKERDKERKKKERETAKNKIEEAKNKDEKSSEKNVSVDMSVDCPRKIRGKRSLSLSYSNKVNITNKVKDIDTIYIDIVNYLNNISGKHFRTNIKKTQSLIAARLKEGFTYEDFVSVIDRKVADWGTDERMSQYIRPETLFGNKFEGYLNDSHKSSPAKVEPTKYHINDVPDDDDELEALRKQMEENLKGIQE